MLNYEISLRDLIAYCKQKYPRASFDEITIRSDREKVRGCHCHPEYSDYNDVIIVESF